MSVITLLAVIALAQTVFMAMIVLLLVFNRQRREAFSARLISLEIRGSRRHVR